MKSGKLLNYVRDTLDNIPASWLSQTTHRLDIYNESLAKVQFLNKFEILFSDNNFSEIALSELPTAFDYIRLGHPLSCLLEWVIAKLNNINADTVISFSSMTMPILAILRTNLLNNKKTKIFYQNELPLFFDTQLLKSVYGYNFDLVKIKNLDEVTSFDGSSIFISDQAELSNLKLNTKVDFYINIQPNLGSTIVVNGEGNKNYISDIQHVRRRESIAMTPANSYEMLKRVVNDSQISNKSKCENNKKSVLKLIKDITKTEADPLLGSCGLSIQYAIIMGLVDDALEKYKGKNIKIIVPPNCYGGTNDQARRVAACIDNVEVVDLPVDSGNDMVESIDLVLRQIAHEDAVPYIIAEIPTNPRVEVPELIKLKSTLSKSRKTQNGEDAIEPVFILDQTFCPNVNFLGENEVLSNVRTISYVSGSKFPSGGLCTAGYCVANKKSEVLLGKIEKHLRLCDNQATELQIEILSQQLPSMIQRIKDAYENTRAFVSFIAKILPEAKINFVSLELADEGFTPSVFSLDLPSKGDSIEEQESYKRELNHKLISFMINKIPGESKHCVSYGQLKGCYWTIPATSTQGTTKEGDKDYIVRVSVAPIMDVDLHKKVFQDFISEI